MQPRIVQRAVYMFPGDHRAFLEDIIDRCARENSGVTVGSPSVRLEGDITHLEVDLKDGWWHDNARVHLFSRMKDAWTDWRGPRPNVRSQDEKT